MLIDKVNGIGGVIDCDKAAYGNRHWYFCLQGSGF